jgi:hypothetical protein
MCLPFYAVILPAPLSSVSTHACSIEALSVAYGHAGHLVATLLETGIFLGVQIPSIHIIVMEIGKRFPCRPSVPRQGITDMDIYTRKFLIVSR